MKKKIRLLILMALCAALIMGVMIVSASAATEVAGGKCGDNLTWSLDSDGLLTIDGTGEMYDFRWTDDRSIGVYRTTAPWGEYVKSIKSVLVGDSVESIGYYAFYGCRSLENVTLGSGLKTIDNYAFEYCSKITYIEIPDSVESIRECAFYDCDSLTSISVSENNNNYSSIDGVLYSKDRTQLICYPSGKTATSFSIPESVESIGDYAFCDCTALESVSLGSGVKTIGDYEFYYCEKLSSIEIPDSVESIGMYAFKYCRALATISFKGDMPSIGYDAFYGVYAIAFYPKGNKTYANAQSSYSNFMWYDDSYAQNDMLFSGTYGENIVWRYMRGGKLTISGTGDMDNYSSSSQPWNNLRNYVKTIEISDGITSIGDYAFNYCETLHEISMGKDVERIGVEAFYKDFELEIVTLGSGLKTIGKNAFTMCGIKSIEIPDSVESIGNSAFSNCSGLESVIIGDGVERIEHGAFYICQKLKSVILGKSVKNIGGWVFGETMFKSIVIPDSVESIEEDAFIACPALKDITFNGKPSSIHSSAFSGVTTATVNYYLEDKWTQSEKQNCGRRFTWKQLTRHTLDTETITEDLPESPHNYTANYSQKFTIEKENAVYITLNFNENTMLGANDVIILTDMYGNDTTYTTDELAGKSIRLDGGKVTIWLNADGTGEAYGFELDSVVAEALHHNYKDVVTPPSCVDQGYTTHTCEFCGVISVGDYVDALKHDFVSGECTRCHSVEILGSGSCGSYASWSLDAYGVLTIGRTSTYYNASVNSSPWRTSLSDKVKTVNVGKNVTYLCNYAFSGCSNLTKVTFEGGAVSLGGSSVFSGVDEDFYIQVTKGDYSWTTSGGYDEENQTWNGLKIVFVGGHDHMFSESVTLDPGCVTTGINTKICSVCGYTVRETIKATGHDYKPVVTEATCIEPGFTTYSCTKCKDMYKTDYVIATGHSFEKTVIAPTCTAYGYTVNVCKCGVFYNSDLVKPVSHDFGEVTYVWSVDKSQCTAMHICKNNPTHIESEIVKSTGSVLQNASSTKNGIKQYTATFTNKAFAGQTVNVFFNQKGTELLCEVYTVKITTTGNGTVTPENGFYFEQGENVTFTVTPDKNYVIEDVKIGGESVGSVTEYTVDNAEGDIDVSVTFAKSKTSIFSKIADALRNLLAIFKLSLS